MSSSLGAITLDSLSRGSGGSLLRSFAAKRCATANDVPPLTDLGRSRRPKETIFLPLSPASSSFHLSSNNGDAIFTRRLPTARRLKLAGRGGEGREWKKQREGGSEKKQNRPGEERERRLVYRPRGLGGRVESTLIV